MTFLQIFVLSLIQGITEFLPISSSGHLILTSVILGWKDQGIALDVAVHVGTLGAVVLYLWREIAMIGHGTKLLLKGEPDDGARLAGYVLLASLPVFVAGYLVASFVGDALRSAAVIGWAFIIFGIILYAADKIGANRKGLTELNVKSAFIIGLAQCFALIPGTSRAGAAITMARFLGIERQAAARFSMLMSIPAICGAATLLGLEAVKTGNSLLHLSLLMGMLFSFVAALIAIFAMMGWLRRQSFTPFVIYRIIAGIVILLVVA